MQFLVLIFSFNNFYFFLVLRGRLSWLFPAFEYILISSIVLYHIPVTGKRRIPDVTALSASLVKTKAPANNGSKFRKCRETNTFMLVVMEKT